MITKEQLDTLCDFGIEENGDYSDRWQFTIKFKNNQSNLCLFNEIDGSLTFVKYLEDFDDLKNVYKAITNTDLSICND